MPQTSKPLYISLIADLVSMGCMPYVNYTTIEIGSLGHFTNLVDFTVRTHQCRNQIERILLAALPLIYMNALKAHLAYPEK